ncbi:alpha/beta family hydrolase [Agrococcus sp. TF02-05]|uniref:alpha/beta hydrolase family protein n=1 Tax=Agrococcus sp. TF02-05 TaxID=2815211 RepID=UPI001AA18B3B|nr:alpha/beta family hydrolase [Agrococcus sp. TF02-05]MBO1769454.1 dienelactone hydrolase [Agrococcus sp. TF02-05]
MQPHALDETSIVPVAIEHPTVPHVDAIVEVPRDPWASLVLMHGAGGSATSPWMVGAARGLVAAGVAVARASFPNAQAGKRQPEREPSAIATWLTVMDAVAPLLPHDPWAGGKSFGGRMAAAAVASGMPAAGLLYLGYPLHSPGKPERLKDAHLDAIALPQRFLQGTNDPFQSGDLLDRLVERLPDARVDWVAGGDHSFLVAKGDRDQQRVAEALGPRIAALLR